MEVTVKDNSFFVLPKGYLVPVNVDRFNAPTNIDEFPEFEALSEEEQTIILALLNKGF